MPWLALALVVALLDQATKGLARQALDYGVPRAVFPGFNLTLLYNTGAAFSLFDDGSGWQRWFFSGIACIVSVAMVIWLHRLERSERWAASALSLILGGAVGNLIDRLMHGYVVDFIQVYYLQHSFPAFNVADSAISIGAVMLILYGPRSGHTTMA